MQLVRHAAEVTVSEKKNKRAPVMSAPSILVATKVIPRRITEVRIVPSIPASIADKSGQQ